MMTAYRGAGPNVSVQDPLAVQALVAEQLGGASLDAAIAEEIDRIVLREWARGA
jgi:hypothetical protein